LAPPGPGQWYYAVDLDISTLSAAQIRQQQHQGGQGSPIDDLLGRLVLDQGLPSRPLHAQTATFTAGGKPPGQ